LGTYVPLVREFVAGVGDDPATYNAAQVRAFVLAQANHSGRARIKSLVNAVRMFLRFLAVTGACSADLAAAVPRIAQWKLAALPRYLNATDVERLVAGHIAVLARVRRTVGGEENDLCRPALVRSHRLDHVVEDPVERGPSGRIWPGCTAGNAASIRARLPSSGFTGVPGIGHIGSDPYTTKPNATSLSSLDTTPRCGSISALRSAVQRPRALSAQRVAGCPPFAG